MAGEPNYQRGSEWRQWDLHIHTPASFHWNGKRFESDLFAPSNKALVDEMIHALNDAQPAVFALMDYWTFDGWFALQQRLQDADAPRLNKKVFPGIELRLAAPMKGRLNAHVLFSNEVDDQTLRDFLSRLTLSLVNRPLSYAALIDLAQNHLGAAKLQHHGYKKEEVDQSKDVALRAGAEIAELTCESYQDAIRNVPGDQAVGYMPYDTNDGLGEIKWQDHYAYFLGLVRSSTIFESRNLDIRGAFVGERTAGNKKFIDEFQKGLSYVPRLVVAGSDAHQFKGKKGDDNHRGYGDFPSRKATWIKADPTFQGLQQALREPAKRSFIGEIPPKLVDVASNKTYFIDSISIDKEPASSFEGHWLSDVSIPLNPDLVAIIGNKGSGKSALADVLALTGNSQQSRYFSFLKPNRFRGKSGDPAKQFIATMQWADGSKLSRNLNIDAPADKVELVRYIPQGHFEDLCNEHVSGRSDAFEAELRAVIFSHTDESTRLGSLDFEQLIDQQERTFRLQLNEFRKDLHQVNQQIAKFEDQLQPQLRSGLNEQLIVKQHQIDEHHKTKPEPVDAPIDQLTPEQQTAAASLEGLAAQSEQLAIQRVTDTARLAAIASTTKAISNLREHLKLLERSHAQFANDAAQDLTLLGMQPNDLVELLVHTAALDRLATQASAEEDVIKERARQNSASQETLSAQQQQIREKLNEPQQAYQRYITAFERWNTRLNELIGSQDAPETLKGIEARLKQLDDVPDQLNRYRERRHNIASEIFGILDAQRRAREELFKPVQQLIQNNSLIRDDYKLQFRSTLGGSVDGFSNALFALIKQNVGEFRGEDESFNTVRKLSEEGDWNDREHALAFAEKLHDKIERAANGTDKPSAGIASLLRKDRTAEEVYDLVFGLSYLEPRYSLMFQDAQIEQLSPGQRGALLLIFYLLVDEGRNPIILDQPEENLDNETVVSLLVPVLTEAKKRRQIIMVTHNPNLAVVCDAEQIVWSHFDRKDQSRIRYISGGIENPRINQLVVNVLEGTKPAFNNRRTKYH